VARSTFDVDILTMDTGVLDRQTWNDLDDQSQIKVTISRAGAGDPLGGVVRFEAAGARTVDLIVGRGEWQRTILSRAGRLQIEDATVPVVQAADLILLKLYAAGHQDAWDIQQLLASGDEQRLVEAVEASLDLLPSESRRLWSRIREPR
jgi:hypothetical protein